MRVAFVSTMTAAPWGGSEALWSATAREALAAGDTVGISTSHWPEPAATLTDLEAGGASWWPRRPRAQPPQEHVGWLARLLGGRPAPSAARASLFQPVFDFRPDVVCISQGGTFDFLLHDELREGLERTACPYVVLCRFNTDDFLVHEYLKPRAAAFLTGARHVAFAAARNLRTAERQIGARLPRASVIQSPLGLAGFAGLPWPAVEEPHFACVARLEAAYKGQDLLLESLSAPEWRARPWRLSFYGEGPDRDALEQLARFYELSDRVRFAGHVPDVPGIWAAHHALVLPSRAEGTPQSLLQAMICGRPAIATDVGGVGDWLSEPAAGFVAAAATAPSIGAALERAWQARACWPQAGQAAREAALARLDRTPARTLLEVLRTVVQAH